MSKLLLIGWDAADWKVITPLMDAGKMPNLQALVERGVMGNITTLHPVLSPMLWTTIATGKRPFKHGILGFSEPSPEGGVRPITNLSRKTRALWNIVNLNGKKANVVGWWPSHPAEPIDGVMISNHFQAVVGKPEDPRPGTVHPPELAEKIAPYRVHLTELTAAHVGPFVPSLGKIDPEKDGRLESVTKVIAECTSVHAAATAVMQLEPWDLMAVYYDAIDHFGHGFMRYHPPKMADVSDEDFETYKGVVESGYRYHDMMLGTLMHLAGEDTTIILCSDHGFHPDHLRPSSIPLEPAGPAVQHRDLGILVMAGPGIKKDERIYGASLLDITPTALHAMGLPVGKDMDGRPLINAFDDGREVKWIDSWDEVEGFDGAHPPDTVIDPLEAQESMDQLVALGYIEPPNENQDQAMRETVRELEYNKAQSYMSANLHVQALVILKQLTNDWPEEFRFDMKRIRCHRALGQIQEAGDHLRATLDRKREIAKESENKLRAWEEEHKDTKFGDLSAEESYKLRRLRRMAGINPFAVKYALAEQALAEDDLENALLHIECAEKMKQDVPTTLLFKGETLLRLKRYEEAETAFRAVLAIDPENVGAHEGLCRSYLKRRQNMLAAGEALTAIGLKYDQPSLHYLLGTALHRMGRLAPAVEALNVALAQAPSFPEALERLAVIHENRFHNLKKAEEYRSRARACREQSAAVKSGTFRPAALSPVRGLMTSDEEVLPVHIDAVPEMLGELSETVVLVSGMPRSGTSMMMQMLDAGGLSALTDGKRTVDDDNQKGYFEYEPVKVLSRQTQWMPETKGKCLKVVAPLLRSLPMSKGLNYRIIFMERDLREVIASQNTMIDRLGKTGSRQSDEQLEETFKKQLRRIQKFLSAASIPVLYVSHRDCIENPAGQAERINRFLGGALDESAMTAIVSGDLYRHRK